jgi:Ca-activated chloride channel family protein
MSFDRPRLLIALFFLIPLLLGAVLHYRRRRVVLSLFPGLANLRLRYRLSSASFFVFFACAVIALAGPRQGFVLIPDHRRGTDLVFALDLSRSMDARDGGGPSRLERAAAIVRSLVAGGDSPVPDGPVPGGRATGGLAPSASTMGASRNDSARYAAVIG